ncbi:GTPase-activating protein CdGAPr isoform X2 [Myzus persicae]|nr:GTPase-activating protein CdGAPr isoform X2 [Myzus persicae]XP_022180816.1 GTPase-activating protein CdGAPr isoform X2 [Myzus persicae]
MPDHTLLSRNSEGRSSGSSVISNGSMRMATLPVTSIDEGKSRFPKLEECAHFHYEHVELGPLKFDLIEEDEQKFGNVDNDNDCWLTIKVESQNTVWVLRRSYENARTLDHQLHKCVYDRKFSLLPELQPVPNDCENPNEYLKDLISKYCKRLSQIAVGSLINCGPILSWLELDNRGHHLLVADGDQCAINTPAVAAAYSVRKYTAHASDEISFDIGDIISVIDMPSPEESVWWRGKHGFLVGFFPSSCVAVITDKVPRNLYINPHMLSLSEPSKPVLRKHGKLISFFRSFILSRPTRRTLKQSGILKERVFGCDLGEHLLNSGRDLPDVLTSCAEFIEKFGIVDGIYRLSGVTSNIQRLRSIFDEDRVPALWEDESIRQDIHSVASLLKLYFRELPNPLCTYQLYDSFVNAVQSIPEKTTEVRLQLMRETVQKLPPPHFRTLEYLMKHLSRVAALGEQTGMTARNVAIVWAPNLLRSKQLENGSGVAALHGVGIQAVVTEFLIRYTDYIFSPIPSVGAKLPPTKGTPKKSRPKSLAISTQTKLLTLEEAQNRVLTFAKRNDPNYIEVGGGPSCLPEKYHTVIDLPSRRCNTNKRRSPSRWKSLFTRGGSSISLGVLPLRKKSEPNLIPKYMDSKECVRQSITEGMNIQDTPKSSKSVSETMSLREIKVTPPCSPPGFCGSNSIGHNRSVSHESYFDQLADQEDLASPILHPSQEDLSDLQVNFDLDESDMRVFSDEDTNHIFSNRSSMEHLQNVTTNNLNCSAKRLPILAHAEDSLSADPSPKKKKITDSSKDSDNTKNNRLSYLEERFASPDIRFIDSQSPEHMTVPADILTECDQIMTDVESNETGTGSLSTITTPTLSYCPLSEESYSDKNSTPGFQTIVIDFCVSDVLTENLLTTPRNRLSYQGDLRNKSLSNDRRSFQEIKLRNVRDNAPCESFNNNGIEEKVKSDISILTESLSSPKKTGSMYEIVMGNNYERLGHKNSIIHQDDSSYEEVMPSCKSSTDSIDNLNFETEKSVENIHYEILVVTSPESCNSSLREISISSQDNLENDNLKIKEITNNQNMLDNNDYLVSPSNEDTEMLIQDRLETIILPIKNVEHIDNVNNITNGANVLVITTEEVSENKADLLLDSNRRKFESEIGRDIVHERRMRKELMENSSSTGNKENTNNFRESLSKFDSNKSPKNSSTWIKNRRLRNNCQHVTSTVSLDAFNFPTDNQNLERVKTSPNLISSEISCQKSEMPIDMDATRRERIERYKEERRQALRERFKTSESIPYDDDIIKRLRAKTLKSPDECTENNINTSIKQPKHLVKIITYDERDTLSIDPEKKEWYTQSLERKKCAKKETKGLVASRVNQLIGCTTSSDEINNKTALKTKTDKQTSNSIRQRAHSTSDRPPQFCIKDMAAFFEQKQ